MIIFLILPFSTQDGKVKEKILCRYEKHWMPFLAEVSSSIETDLNFCPPIDIHWVWHVHMLAPVR